MDEHELRVGLAKRLKVSEVPPPLWDDLVEEGYVREALAGGRDERGDLERVARRRLALARALGGRETTPRTVSTVHPKPVVGEYEMERALATGEAVALEAAREPRVRQFRRRFLGGGPLLVPEARRLLASPAAQLLPRDAFERRGIPIIGHRSEIVGRTARLGDDGFVAVEVVLRVMWSGGEHEETVRQTVPPTQFGRGPALAFVDETGERYEVEVWPRSVLDRLRELAEWVTKWYGWEREAAAWFVLTDDPPIRAPLEGGIAARLYPTHQDYRVTLVVEPWVPADAVLRAYRDAQRDLLGRENRPLAARNLALLRFVVGEKRNEGRKPERERQHLPWAWLMARWNETHPEAHYTEERLFARDVGRARRAVLFPDYHLAGPGKDGEQ